MDEIKVVCAWCQRHLAGPSESDHISHGICEKCDYEVHKEIEAMYRELGGEG